MKHTAEIAVRRTVIQKNCGWNENKNSIQGNERHSAFIFMILPRLFFPGITPVMPVAMIAGSSIAMSPYDEPLQGGDCLMGSG
jgi:hypothetical protein